MHHVYGLADQLWNLPKYTPKLGQMLDVFNDFRVHERIGHPMLTNQHIPTPYIGFKLKYHIRQPLRRADRHYSSPEGITRTLLHKDARTTNVICPEVLIDEVRNLLAVMRSICSHSRFH